MTAFADEHAAEPEAAEGEAIGPEQADSPGESHAPAVQESTPHGDASAPEDPLTELKAKARLSDSLQREIRRLHGVLKATKEQNRRLRSGVGTREATLETDSPGGGADAADAVQDGAQPKDSAIQDNEQAKDSTVQEPEAASPGQPDADGLVEFAGMRLTPEVAERLRHAEAAAARLEQLEGEVGRRDEEELLAEIAGLADAYETNTQRAVIELRRQIIPLEGEAEQIADEVLLALVNQDLTRASREGGLTVFTLTPEKIHEFGLKAVDRLHKAFSIFGARQLESNQQYRETHRAVRPGGSPAVQPPKGWKQMTPAEREEFLARSAAAVLRHGSG